MKANETEMKAERSYEESCIVAHRTENGIMVPLPATWDRSTSLRRQNDMEGWTLHGCP
jgi:hypothetical protein